jgi:hypothetical protein
MKETLQNALDELDDKYIAEAVSLPKKRPHDWFSTGAFAAMLTLLIGISFLISHAPNDPAQLGSFPNNTGSLFPFSSTNGSSGLHSSGSSSCYPLPPTLPTQPPTHPMSTTLPTQQSTFPTLPILPTLPTLPTIPADTLPPSTDAQEPTTHPPLPPNTMPLFNSLKDPQKIIGLSQIGSRPQHPVSAPVSPAYAFDTTEMVVHAKVIEVLPGVYKDTLTNRCYHILKLETLEAIYVKNMPEEFYLRLSTDYSTDLKKFTSLVLSIQQVGIENYLLNNWDQAQIQAFSLLFELTGSSAGPFYDSYGDLIAFTDGVWDKRLYKMEGWELSDYYIERLPTDYPVRDGYTTIEDCKSRILQRISKQNSTPKKVYTAADIATGAAQEELLAWVAPFKNGVYAQKFNKSGSVEYTRLINNFPTNEVIRVSQAGANWLSEHFTEEELLSLPDLGAFLTDLQQYKLETMNSPHAEFYKNKAVYLKSIWAEGKYYKVNGQVYGLVKVCWAYWTSSSSNAHKWPGSYVDAMYYLISADGSYVVAQRDEIAQLLGEDFLESEYDVLEPFPPI